MDDVVLSECLRPYKSTSVWRFFSYNKMTCVATCLVENCNAEIKVSKNSPKNITSHLKSKKHQMTDEQINPSVLAHRNQQIIQFVKKAKVDSMESNIVRLVAKSNILLQKIATDDELQ